MLNIRNYHKTNLYDMAVSDEYVVKLKKLNEYKENEKPSIVSNTMFKTMFYNTNRLKYSAKFISYYLDISYEELLNNITLVKSELDKEYNDTKEERSDYVAQINDTKINIEVNNNESVETMERNMEYAFRIYSEKIKIGTDYKYNYNQVVQLNINNFSFIGNDKIMDIYSFQNDEGIVLNPKITIIQIYVPNLRKKCYTKKKEDLSEAERYLLGLVEIDKDYSLELGDDLEIMIEYVNEAGEVTMGTNFGEAYDKEWAITDQAKREGINQTKKELTVKMYQKGMSIEDISDITEFSIDEIQKIIAEFQL